MASRSNLVNNKNNPQTGLGPQAGFSLLELLTAVSIVVILSSLFLANFHGQGTRTALNNATSMLISDTHRLQDQSLSSRDVSSGNPASRYVTILTNGATSYNLIGYNNATPATSTVLITSGIGPNVSVSSIQVTKVDNTVVTPATLTVGFEVPYGKLVLNYAGSLTDEVNDIARIKLISSDNSICSYVFLNGITGNITTTSSCP